MSPLTDDFGVEGIRSHMSEHNIDAFLAIGGNGTQTVSHILSEAGIPIVGLPKTIDNDLEGSDYFGFDTAVSIATEAIDRLRTAGESHRRCMVLEVMGRDAGWIALNAGMAGGAQIILLSEYPESIDQIAAWVSHVKDRGRTALVVVAEGFKLEGMDEEVAREGLDGFGRPRLGGVAEVLAPLIEGAAGIETRATVLRHIQRGEYPQPSTGCLRHGQEFAAQHAVNDGAFGKMIASRGDSHEACPTVRRCEQNETRAAGAV